MYQLPVMTQSLATVAVAVIYQTASAEPDTVPYNILLMRIDFFPAVTQYVPRLKVRMHLEKYKERYFELKMTLQRNKNYKASEV